MNDPHDRAHRPRRLDRRSSVSGKHFAGLASRVAPLFVLAIGSLWWMTSMQTAQGQYQNRQGFRPQQYQQPGQNYTTTAVPSIQSASMTGQPEHQLAATEEEGSIITWEMPAFVTKIAQGCWLMIPLAV